MTEAINSVIPGQLFVVSAPSGAGKTSLVRALIEKDPSTGVSVSHTTRQQRPGEVDGVNYHFINDLTFKSMIDGGEFLEWAHVFDHLYGTSIDAARDVLNTGKNLILEIDWQGAEQVRHKVAGTQSIFIFPPSLKALRDRLDGRNQDDHATVEKRMNAAFEELSHYAEYDYLIINDDFDTATAELTEIINGRGNDFRRETCLTRLEGLISNLLPG